MSTKVKNCPSTLTVGELKALLEDFGDDQPVVFACDYGDYHHTQQALGIGQADETRLVKEAYSRSGFGLPSSDPDDDEESDEGDDEGTDDDEEDEPLVVVLTSR